MKCPEILDVFLEHLPDAERIQAEHRDPDPMAGLA